MSNISTAGSMDNGESRRKRDLANKAALRARAKNELGISQYVYWTTHDGAERLEKYARRARIPAWRTLSAKLLCELAANGLSGAVRRRKTTTDKGQLDIFPEERPISGRDANEGDGEGEGEGEGQQTKGPQ